MKKNALVLYVREWVCGLRRQQQMRIATSRRCENKQGFSFISDYISSLVSRNVSRLCRLLVFQKQNSY